MNKIIFTGGGSGGHVIPAITLIKSIKEKRPSMEIFYIGSHNSIESQLVPDLVENYFPVLTGKLRRYLSVENVKDIFKVFIGLVQCFFLMIRFSKKETLVFSTGGFVSVPVVIAAWLTGKRIYLHEQTTRMGLANKICSKFADKVFVSFEESLKFLGNNAVLSGYPVRSECYSDSLSTKSFREISLVDKEKKLLFITGGGNGSKLINDKVQESIDKLKEEFKIIHQVGKNFVEDFSKFNDESYVAVDFIGPEMIDIMKGADVILSRSGAGTVCELMAMKKRSIYIPLKIAQKNEQFHNAKAAQRLCGSLVIEEDQFKKMTLLEVIKEFNNSKFEKDEKEKILNGLEFLENEIMEM